MPARRPRPSRSSLGLFSGAGLVVANMIGAGVFLSTGFMAQDLGPGRVLLAWVAGGVIALLGVRAYAEVARLVPGSGGEYRYLADLLHPAIGYLAGWTSLLVGFSAPIAVSAVAAGHFAATLGFSLPPRLTGAMIVLGLTALHALGFEPSRRTQDVLVAVKAALLVVFVLVGLLATPFAWPAWTPPRVPPSPVAAFMSALFYVAFAFSGWNAAVYAAGEFTDARRDVPRAMWLGTSLVALLYLALNWVFVARLTPERAAVVLSYESARVTLGHLVMRDILGEVGGRATSALILVAFVSSMSAMIFAGPRVYAAMARDGFLPGELAGPGGVPTPTAVLLQGGLALVVLFTQPVQQVLQNVGALLTLFAALVAVSLLRVGLAPGHRPRPAPGSLLAAAAFTGTAMVLLYFGLRESMALLGWMMVIVGAALVFYLASGRAGRPRP